MENRCPVCGHPLTLDVRHVGGRGDVLMWCCYRPAPSFCHYAEHLSWQEWPRLRKTRSGEELVEHLRLT